MKLVLHHDTLTLSLTHTHTLTHSQAHSHSLTLTHTHTLSLSLQQEVSCKSAVSSTMSKTNPIIHGWAEEKRKNIISRKTAEQ
jgi:hypothetical protein